MTDANGLTSTRTRSYQVFGATAPDFTFTPPAPGEGANVNFTDTSLDPFGIGYREWVWGDGTANTVNSSPVGHVFADNGSYSVTLRVLNNRGLSAATTKTVTVANVTPTVDAGPNQTVVWGQPWAISPSIFDAGAVDRTSLVCSWDFGDGQTATVPGVCNSSSAALAHAYANPGTYTATLTVRDKENASASDFLTVTVTKRPTLLNIYAALSSTSAGEVEVGAKLVDRFEVGQGVAGRPVVFTLGSQTVTVTTNAEGIAIAVLTFAPGVINTVTATYDGDAFYVPAADTDSFNPVSVFPETPSLRNDQSEIVAMVPSPGGRVQNGGMLSTVGFSAGYAPLILVVDPLVVGDATKANPLPGFDTVALNGICDIGSNLFLGNATFRGRVQDFVVRGGKLIIWDSECPTTDYSKFFLPFSTNNPGALGASGTLLDVEENSLSSGIATSPAFVNVGLISTGTDAVGDANVFLTFDPNWCVDMTARNAVIPEFKPVHTYAVLGRGLLIYSGLDRDAMQANAAATPNSGAFFLAKIWERELKQPWNPSGLPCDVAATQANIVLAPVTATLDVGQVHTVTATVTAVNGTPLPSVFVNLVVTGANAFAQQGTTNGSGVATFTYTGTHFGNDALLATAGAIQSNPASAHWNAAPVADAGDDQLVGTGSLVTLDGSRSSDPNPGDVLTYSWRQLSGPVVTLDDPASVRPKFTPTEAGDHVFELRVSDGRLSAIDTVKITAEIRNRPPVAQDQTVTTDEDVPVAILLGATDPDGDTLTFTLLSAPTHGTLTGTAPNLTYTPAANYSGPDGFTFKVADSLVSSNVATVSITVRPVNNVPVAHDQSVATDEDTPLPIVLTASDVEGDALTFTIVAPPAHGALTGTGASLTYTPAPNYNGLDSFTFIANDGQADSNTATVSITVRPVNDAPVANDQAVTTDEDTGLPIELTASDVDGDTLAYTVVAQPTHGTLTGTGASLTYTPAPNYSGPDSFTFTANDGQVDSNTATISITVRPVNDAPVANDQAVATDEDTALPIELTASDVDGDTLAYTVVTQPTHGTLTGTGASLTYTPASNYNGPDSFTFTANDGQVDSNTATVSITVRPVNDAPVANDQAVATDEDTAVPIDADRVRRGRGHPDLHRRRRTDAWDADGHGRESHLHAGAELQRSRQLHVHGQRRTGGLEHGDGQHHRASGERRAGGQRPGGRDGRRHGACPSTLTASDVDGDTLTYTVVAQPTHGTLTGTGAILTYTPAPNYNGPDSFTFAANDGQADSNTATVSITVRPVNDAPVANHQAVATDEDTPLPIVLTASDVDGDPLGYAILTAPAHGTLTGTGAILTYTPAPNYNGPDSFTFRANDGQLDSNPATVGITVRPVDDPPTAAGQEVATNEDTALPVVLVGSDVEGDPLSYTILTAPAHGTLSGAAPGLSYTPAPNYTGPDTFTFKVNDGQADSNIATVIITVRPLNDAPVAQSQTVVTDEDVARPVVLVGTDADGDPLTYTVLSAPAHGTLSGTGRNLTYTPALNYNGPDNFTFRVNDGHVNSNVATVGITVRPVNDAPVCTAARAVPDRLWPPNHRMVPILIPGVTDVDGDGIAIRATSIRQDEVVRGSRHDEDDHDGHDGRHDHKDYDKDDKDGRYRNLGDHRGGDDRRGDDRRGDDRRGDDRRDDDDDHGGGGSGSGNTSPDGILAPLKVRAERSGQGNGRIYHIGFEATDGHGGVCTAVVLVCVPHDQHERDDDDDDDHDRDRDRDRYRDRDRDRDKNGFQLLHNSGGHGPRPDCVDGGPRYDSTKP